MSTTLPNQFESPRHDGPLIARRRVTRRGAGAAPFTDDDVPVLLRIPDLSTRAASDPVKPEPPSAVIAAPSSDEIATIKFVPASGDPPGPTDRIVPTDRSDRSDLADTTAKAASHDKRSLREPSAQRRQRREIPPPAESGRAVATQWGVIVLLVVVAAAVYYSFTGKSNETPNDGSTDSRAGHFVPIGTDSTQAEEPSDTSSPNESHADTSVNSEPAVEDAVVAPTLDGPRHDPPELAPRPTPLKRQPPEIRDDKATPRDTGPVEEESPAPAATDSYPMTDPANYEYSLDNVRAPTARLNGVQPWQARDRR